MTKKDFIENLRELVRFQTLSDNRAENLKLIDFVVSKIDTKAIIKRYTNKDAEILLLSNKKPLEPDICFLVHSDVVSAPDKLFKLKIKGDLAFGRGVSDMKFTIPIGTELLNKLIKGNSKLSFAFVVTTDEESGGFSGVKYLIERLKFRPKALIVPDGGDNLLFVNKSKGVCQIQVTTFGRSAHSSRIFDGKNAIEPLIELLNELLAIYGKNNRTQSWRTTLNIGQIQGGISTNQVCERASCNLDFRFPETSSVGEIFSEVKKLAKKTNKSIKISLLSTGDPTFIDTQSKIVKRFIETLETETNTKIKIGRTFGASDARHFSRLKIPVLMIKPIGGSIHSEDEFVSINSCLEFERAISAFLLREENYGQN